MHKNELVGSSFFDNQMDQEILTTKEAAAFLRISPNALRIKVCRGLVKCLKLGGHNRFHKNDLKVLLKKGA